MAGRDGVATVEFSIPFRPSAALTASREDIECTVRDGDDEYSLGVYDPLWTVVKRLLESVPAILDGRSRTIKTHYGQGDPVWRVESVPDDPAVVRFNEFPQEERERSGENWRGVPEDGFVVEKTAFVDAICQLGHRARSRRRECDGRKTARLDALLLASASLRHRFETDGPFDDVLRETTSKPDVAALLVEDGPVAWPEAIARTALSTGLVADVVDDVRERGVDEAETAYIRLFGKCQELDRGEDVVFAVLSELERRPDPNAEGPIVGQLYQVGARPAVASRFLDAVVAIADAHGLTDETLAAVEWVATAARERDSRLAAVDALERIGTDAAVEQLRTVRESVDDDALSAAVDRALTAAGVDADGDAPDE